jgi:hypothetical protein
MFHCCTVALLGAMAQSPCTPESNLLRETLVRGSSPGFDTNISHGQLSSEYQLVRCRDIPDTTRKTQYSIGYSIINSQLGYFFNLATAIGKMVVPGHNGGTMNRSVRSHLCTRFRNSKYSYRMIGCHKILFRGITKMHRTTLASWAGHGPSRKLRTLIDWIGGETSGSLLLPRASLEAVLFGRLDKSIWFVMRMSCTLSRMACISSCPFLTSLLVANNCLPGMLVCIPGRSQRIAATG